MQDIPTYPGSKLDLLVVHLEPIIYNDTLKDFNLNVPNVMKLTNSTTDAVSGKSMEKVIANDTFIKDIFTNVSQAKNVLVSDSHFDDYNVQGLLDARLRKALNCPTNIPSLFIHCPYTFSFTCISFFQIIAS